MDLSWPERERDEEGTDPRTLLGVLLFVDVPMRLTLLKLRLAVWRNQAEEIKEIVDRDNLQSTLLDAKIIPASPPSVKAPG